jgi:hypothetical protein
MIGLAWVKCWPGRDELPVASTECRRHAAMARAWQPRRTSMLEDMVEAATSWNGASHKLSDCQHAGAQLYRRCSSLGIYSRRRDVAHGTAPPDPTGPGRTWTRGGHHIHQQAAFTGHPRYNSRQALALRHPAMDQGGYSHSNMTTMQRQLYDELAESFRGIARSAIPMREHNRIAVAALVAGGVAHQQARYWVAASLLNLRNMVVNQQQFLESVGCKVTGIRCVVMLLTYLGGTRSH